MRRMETMKLLLILNTMRLSEVIYRLVFWDLLQNGQHSIKLS